MVENHWFEIRGIVAVGAQKGQTAGQLEWATASRAFDHLEVANGCALMGPQREAIHQHPEQHNQDLVR